MTGAKFNVITCKSCYTPMLTYHAGDRLILYVCPSCVDWSA